MWTLAGIQIITQKHDGVDKQIIARLQPLSGGTVIQTFGYENSIQKIGGYVVGDADMDALKALKMTGATHALVENSTSRGSFYVSNVSWSRTPWIYQTIRPDLDCESPVYNVEVELYL